MILQSRTKKMKVDKPLVMGVLNLTPDSFSDGGKFESTEDAVKYAKQMVKDGADIIDIGGESTGPGSKDVDSKEEFKRVLPVLKALKVPARVWISIDTYKADVARAALKAGANMVNDVLALRGDEKMAKLIAKEKVPVVLMYSKDDSGRTSRKKPKYENVVDEVQKFLKKRIKVAKEAGIKDDQIVLDPGQGAFVSMDAEPSLKLLKNLKKFKAFGYPVLIGSSRKSFIGETLDLPLEERLEGSLACAVAAVLNGATIIRAHDVKETRRAVDMVWAIKNA